MKIKRYWVMWMVAAALAANFAFAASLCKAEEQPAFKSEAASLVKVAGREESAVFWLKLIPTSAGLEQLVSARRQAGLEPGRFGAAAYVLCQVDVRPDRFVIIQQLYFDAAGVVIADWTRTDWASVEPPGAIIASQAQAVLPDYFKLKANNLPPGFAGIPWGSSPASIPGATQDETMAEVLRVYVAVVDVSALLGDVPQVKEAWMLFDRDRGLQRGAISFDGRNYEKVLQRLTDLLGNPRWKPGRGGLYWSLANDLKIEIEVMPAFGMLHGLLKVENPQFAAYEAHLFGRPE